jgi:toxin CptA
MTIDLFSAGFLLALILVGVMGFAIQRGATCTVAAVDEILSKRRAHRLRSLLEASIWVTGGILVARALQLSAIMPAGFAIDWTTILGAALLGFGAWVNRACVFGAVARFGSGDLAYIFTPVGFFAGALAFQTYAPPSMQPLPDASPVLASSQWLAVAFALFALWRLTRAWSRKPPDQPFLPWLRRSVWAPGAATVVIGITFVLVLFLIGASWAYTDVLAEFARGAGMGVLPRALLLLALLVGAVIGGITANRVALQRLTGGGVMRCFTGGVLMGFGSLMIPGSNDGLILLGMPLLWPHAWLAFAVMCATIAVAMTLAARLQTARTA